MQLRLWPIAVFLLLLSILGLSVSAICGEEQSKRERQPGSDGFIRIFDGKTLDGWHAVPKESASDWTVRDGAIVGHGSADRLSYLVWKDEHLTDFELELRYRLPGKGNTGVDIRSQPDPSGKRPFEGYHADLGHVGIGPHILGAWDFHFARRTEYPCPRGTRLVIDEDGKPHASTIRGALTVADVRRHQWNDVRIIARGYHFKFFINNKLASEFTDNAKRGRLNRGTIGLQIHEKGMRVEFKDIRLKRPASASQSGERAPVGLQKQLFVDDHVVAEKHNLTRELGRVKKVGVVMEPSVPTDFHPTRQFPDGLPATGGLYGSFGYRLTVLWDEQGRRFQMWYRASAEQLTAYAESKDGIHWTKPPVSRDGKSNLIMHHGEFGCMIDPTVAWGKPDKYKAAFNGGNARCAIGYSSDGIHWKSYNQGRSVTGRAADTMNQILWDPLAGRYMLLTRTDVGSKGGKTEDRATRIMAHARNNDLAAHPTQWETLVQAFTVADPEGRKTPAGVEEYQMEAMTIWIYENVYFGLMHVLRMGDVTGSGHKVTMLDLQTRHEKDVIDSYVGTSRDGIHFDRHWVHAKRPLVPRGPDGSFDKDMLHAASEIITHKDEHWIYYSGFDHRHHSRGGSGKIGLAKLRLDGFICLEAKHESGMVVTKPFRLEGGRVEVNVDASAGRVQIEMLDEEGKPIAGFSGKDAPEYRAVDNLRLKPAWKNHEDLSTLKGKVVRIRFRLRNARLYAFRIQ